MHFIFALLVIYPVIKCDTNQIMSNDIGELDRLYSPSMWSVRFSTPQEVLENHFQYVTLASEAVVKNIPHELNIKYGPTHRQKLDIFGTDLSNDAPIFVYIHGGYWQKLSREQSRYATQPLYNSQIKSIVVGYELCPTVTLPEIVKEIEDAVKFIFKYAQTQGSRGVYFAGHSAGAHLLAIVLSNAHLINNLPNFDLLKGVFLISGVYDLQDLIKTYVNDAVKLPQELAVSFSPLSKTYEHLRDRKVQIHIIMGVNESPTFKEQSRDFYDLLVRGYSPLYTYLDIKNDYDHFNIVETLSEEDNYLKRLLIENLTSNQS